MTAGRPGPRRARRVLVALVVVVVLAVAADRIGDLIAERTAGDTLQSSQHLQHRPDVSIAGFPFLTQFAAGSYDKVTVTADDVPIGRGTRQLDLARLVVVLRTLDVNRSFTRFHARTATATGTVSYADLGHALGVTVRYRGNSRIQASTSITVLGHTVRPTVTTRPRLVNDGVSFGRVSINGASDLTRQALAAIDDVFAVHLPVSDVPFDVRVRALHVDAQGLQVTLAGHDVTYDR